LHIVTYYGKLVKEMTDMFRKCYKRI